MFLRSGSALHNDLQVGTTYKVWKRLPADVSYASASFTKDQIITAATEVFCADPSAGDVCSGGEGSGSPTPASGFDSAVQVELRREFSEGNAPVDSGEEENDLGADDTPTIVDATVAAALGVNVEQIDVSNTAATAGLVKYTVGLGDG